MNVDRHHLLRIRLEQPGQYLDDVGHAKYDGPLAHDGKADGDYLEDHEGDGYGGHLEDEDEEDDEEQDGLDGLGGLVHHALGPAVEDVDHSGRGCRGLEMVGVLPDAASVVVVFHGAVVAWVEDGRMVARWVDVAVFA